MKIAIAEYCRRFSRRLASPIRSLPSSVGHWQASQEGFVSDYVIENDGTFTGYVAQNGTPLWTCAGKWTLSGKTVSTVLTRSSSDKIPVGTKDRESHRGSDERVLQPAAVERKHLEILEGAVAASGLR